MQNHAPFWEQILQNYTNHAQEYHHSNWLRKSWKMMYNTCGCTSQQLDNHAKSWKMVMQNHEKWSCKSCTRLSPLWQKTKKNDVWYVGVNLPKMQNHEIWSCKIMQTMHKTSTIVTGSKNHGKWCVICRGIPAKNWKVIQNHAKWSWKIMQIMHKTSTIVIS